MAVTALLKLAGLSNDLGYVNIAHQALAQMQPPTGGGMMSQYPLGFGQWLQALSYALSKPREIAITRRTIRGFRALHNLRRPLRRTLAVGHILKDLRSGSSLRLSNPRQRTGPIC
jgi:uncharacterized protein YyaL (SSP411 family)